MQLILGSPQMRFRSFGMSSHLVMVGRLDDFDLMDRFMDVHTHPLYVVPVMNSLGDRDSADKRQARGSNGDYDRFLHFSPRQLWIFNSDADELLGNGQNYSPPIAVKTSYIRMTSAEPGEEQGNHP